MRLSLLAGQVHVKLFEDVHRGAVMPARVELL